MSSKYKLYLVTTCLPAMGLSLIATPAQAGFEWTPPAKASHQIVASQPVAPVEKTFDSILSENTQLIQERKIEHINEEAIAPEVLKKSSVEAESVLNIMPTPATKKAPAKAEKLALNLFPEVNEDHSSEVTATINEFGEIVSMSDETAEETQAVEEKAETTSTLMPEAESLAATETDETIEGFGSEIPLVLALGQIVPAKFAYSFDKSVNPAEKISWDGGKPWDDVLKESLEEKKLEFTVIGNTILIKKKLKNQQDDTVKLTLESILEKAQAGLDSKNVENKKEEKISDDTIKIVSKNEPAESINQTPDKEPTEDKISWNEPGDTKSIEDAPVINLDDMENTEDFDIADALSVKTEKQEKETITPEMEVIAINDKEENVARALDAKPNIVTPKSAEQKETASKIISINDIKKAPAKETSPEKLLEEEIIALSDAKTERDVPVADIEDEAVADTSSTPLAEDTVSDVINEEPSDTNEVIALTDEDDLTTDIIEEPSDANEVIALTDEDDLTTDIIEESKPEVPEKATPIRKEDISWINIAPPEELEALATPIKMAKLDAVEEDAEEQEDVIQEPVLSEDMAEPLDMTAPAPEEEETTEETQNQAPSFTKQTSKKVMIWKESRGADLKDVLTHWCAKENVELVWNAENTYPLSKDVFISGTFENAMPILLLKGVDTPPRFKIENTPHVRVVISDMQ